MITIGALAERYHLLPSEVAARATSFDLEVAAVMSAWEQQKLDESQGRVSSDLSQDQLQAMLDSVRNKDSKNGR
jgi:hypothetical protein